MQAKLTLLIMICCFQSLMGQVCTPNSFYQDSIGIFPKPEQPEIPGSGITAKACIGIPYKYDFTVRIPDTIIYAGFQLAISQAYLPDNAVSGLPEGITYACVPTDCIFPTNELHCISLLGVPGASNTPGEFPLVIKVKVVTGFGTIDLNFPDPALAPGQYILRLEDANSPYCQSLGVYDPSANLGDLLVVPNPAADRVNINFNMDQPGPIHCQILSSSGSIVRESISLAIGGKNQITADVSTLPAGIYYVQIIRKDGVQHASFQVIK